MSEQMEESENQGGSQAEGQEEGEYGEEESAQDDDIFKNNHDLIGVEGILRAQKNEVDKKKVSIFISNKLVIKLFISL